MATTVVCNSANCLSDKKRPYQTSLQDGGSIQIQQNPSAEIIHFLRTKPRHKYAEQMVTVNNKLTNKNISNQIEALEHLNADVKSVLKDKASTRSNVNAILT